MSLGFSVRVKFFCFFRNYVSRYIYLEILVENSQQILLEVSSGVSLIDPWSIHLAIALDLFRLPFSDSFRFYFQRFSQQFLQNYSKNCSLAFLCIFSRSLSINTCRGFSSSSSMFSKIHLIKYFIVFSGSLKKSSRFFLLFPRYSIINLFR